ncbi:GAF domain-containing SpoIIE family protein phosphatase [Cellulomonas hominis]
MAEDLQDNDVDLPLETLLPARSDEAFERFSRLAQRHLGVPVALVSLVSSTGEVLPGATGLPPELDAARSLPLSHSLCRYVVSGRAPLVVEDARDDERLRTHGAVIDLDVRAYAGFPLLDDQDRVVGSLCAIDLRPRPWNPPELAFLADLAAACSSELRLRGERERARRSQQLSTASYRHSRLLLLLSEAFTATVTIEDVADTVARVASTGLGATMTGIALLDRDGRGLTYTSLAGFADEGIEELRHARLSDARPVSLVAQNREAQFYPDQEAMVAEFPDLRDRVGERGGGRAFLPLVSRQRLLGVLVLGWQLPRDFSRDNREVKYALAGYTAQALERAMLLQDRREVAHTLQDAMLTALPSPARLELAARYLPAGGDKVGGDWYDAVELDEGGLALMVGDVTGHDMDAAARMGQLRSTLRAFAWDRGDSPGAWLSRLDRANRALGQSSVATALAGRLSPLPGGSFRFCWSSAGHPPPVVVRAGGAVETLHRVNDLLIGIDPQVERHDHSCELGPGDTVLLHTDGLVERRDRPLAAGQAGLEAALDTLGELPPEELVHALTDALVGQQPSDDVALLVVRVRRSAPDA